MAEHGIVLTEKEAQKCIDDNYKTQLQKAIDKEKAYPSEWWED